MLPLQNLTWLELICLNHCSKYVYTQRYGSRHSSGVFVLELTDVVAKTKKPWHSSTELCLRVCFVSNCKCHVHFSLLIIYLWLRYRESFILLKIDITWNWSEMCSVEFRSISSLCFVTNTSEALRRTLFVKASVQ